MSSYAHGYFREMVALLEQRTAANEAAFFTAMLQPAMALLDVGCGPGTLTAGLARHVGSVVGLDADGEQVARAQVNAAGVPNATFQQGDASHLPFADATFDAVFAHTLLQHLQDPTAALREMHRVLKPGGVLGVREEDWGGTFFHPASPARARGIEIVIEDWRRLGGDPYLPRRYRALLRTVGFAHVKTGADAVVHEGSGAQSWGELAGAYLLAPQTKARVIAAGLADEAFLSALREEWRAWGADPDAFWSMTYVHAVALKAR